MRGEMSLFSHRWDFFLSLFFFSPLFLSPDLATKDDPCYLHLPASPSSHSLGWDGCCGSRSTNPSWPEWLFKDQKKNHFMETVFPVFSSWEKIPINSFGFLSGLFFICRLGAFCAAKNPKSLLSLNVLFGLE